jgi:pimeloyl-ACP methyl ester carboxylesterase
MKTILTATLELAYEEFGPVDGPPVILMQGFPDDVHAYDGVSPSLAASGWRVIVPYSPLDPSRGPNDQAMFAAAFNF